MNLGFLWRQVHELGCISAFTSTGKESNDLLLQKNDADHVSAAENIEATHCVIPLNAKF